jgi:hypothetical protein
VKKRRVQHRAPAFDAFDALDESGETARSNALLAACRMRPADCRGKIMRRNKRL